MEARESLSAARGQRVARARPSRPGLALSPRQEGTRIARPLNGQQLLLVEHQFRINTQPFRYLFSPLCSPSEPALSCD